MYIYIFIWKDLFLPFSAFPGENIPRPGFRETKFTRAVDKKTVNQDAVISLAENPGRLRVCYVLIQEQRRGSGAAAARGAVPRGPP